jgi:general secretion pathway protein C
MLVPRELTPKQSVQLFVDAMDAVGLVVTQQPDTLIVKLGPGMPKSCPDVADTSPPAATPPSSSPPSAQDDTEALDKVMDAGIHLTDDTHVEINRAAFDRMLANPGAVTRGARVVPSVKDGKPYGFKLYAIRPRSLFARVGFLNGDTLVMLNGFELTSLDNALQLYTKLRDATFLAVDIVRRDRPLTIAITIR